MSKWPVKLFVYQINTWVWLNALTRKYMRPITLDNVPDEELDAIAQPNVDIIWLMGIWQRSPFGRKNALKYKHEYVGALPDITDDDIIGSAYAIGDYEVDRRLGGRVALAKLRARLKDRNLQLILDYVPNHVAIDHPWIEKPGYIITGSEQDLKNRPSDFFAHTLPDGKKAILAHGRDPYFPGWSDTAQLNAFNPELRDAVVNTLVDIASQCDGVRCDMAMLLMNNIFGSTWRGHIGAPPAEDYWPYIIPRVKEKYPDFQFVAEVYWGKEYEILQQGFDFAYDKVLYDRIIDGDVQKLRAHLVAEIDYQKHMMRFIENHDEPRAFATMGLHKGMAAATLICTLPGACLLHDGQFSGRKVKLPVQIKRGPEEPMQEELYTFYLKLLKETRSPIYQTGQWYLFEATPAGEGDHTWMNLLVYGWREVGTNWRLMVVNLTDRPSYARIPLRFWNDLANERWILHDVIDGERYERDGNRMMDEGLFVALQPYESHIFRFERVIHLELETTEMLQYQQQVKQAARPKGMTGELRLKAEETQK